VYSIPEQAPATTRSIAGLEAVRDVELVIFELMVARRGP